MKLAYFFLLLPFVIFPMPANTGAEGRGNQANWNVEWRAYYAPVQSGCPAQNSIRIASFGNSWPEGYSCTVGQIGDGWRAFLSRLLYNRGITAQWVGTRTGTFNTVLGCPKTDGLSGAEVPAIYAQLDVIPTIMPTPLASDIIILGPALANLPGKSLATCIAEEKALITRTAALAGALPKILVTTDLTRGDGVDMTNYFNGTYQGYTWAYAQGHNVFFGSISSAATVIATDRCADLLHLTDKGNSEVAGSLNSQWPQ